MFAFFTPKGALRLYPKQHYQAASAAHPQVARILTIDVERKRIATECHVASPFPGLFLRPSSDGERLLVLERGRTIVSLYSGDGCQKIATLPAAGKLRAAAFSNSDGVTLVSRSGETAVVQTFSSAGDAAWSAVIPASTADAAVYDRGDGKAAIVALNPFARTDGRWQAGWKFYRVSSGGVSPIDLPGCWPADAGAFWHAPALASGTPQLHVHCAHSARTIDL
jgi:hypothetical protein